MAGEWIKLRTNLFTDPRVARVALKTRQTKSAVIGAFCFVWSIADEHGESGELPGLDAELLDAEVGIDGFADEAIAVDWLLENSDGRLHVPRFEEHNSKTAKRRASENRRKRDKRKPENESPPADETTDAGPTDQEPTKPRATTTSEQWVRVASRLQRAGVNATSAAIRSARANGWSAKLANEVVDHFEANRGAWLPVQLYERFQLKATAAAEGWPERSIESKREAALYASSERERKRREEHRAKCLEVTNVAAAISIRPDSLKRKAVS